jgi:hypothetical protein
MEGRNRFAMGRLIYDYMNSILMKSLIAQSILSSAAPVEGLIGRSIEIKTMPHPFLQMNQIEH